MASSLKHFIRAVLQCAIITLLLRYSWGTSNPTCDSSFRANLEDLKQGILTINAFNPTSETARYSHFLSCPSLKVVGQAREQIIVRSKRKRASRYIVEISKRYLADHPEKYEHRCTHVMWQTSNINAASIKCDVLVRTFPGGKFLKNCFTYDGKDLVLDEVIDKGIHGKSIKLVHSGNLTHYVANTSCIPILSALNKGNMYRHLRNGETWRIRLPPNCSNTLDVDYEGMCRLSIYHMCQERSLVEDHAYPYFEGNVEQCVEARSQIMSSMVLALWDTVLSRAGLILLSFLACTVFLIVATVGVRSSVVLRAFGIDKASVVLEGDLKRVLHSLDLRRITCAKKLKEGVEKCSVRFRDRGKKIESRTPSTHLLAAYSSESEEELFR